MTYYTIVSDVANRVIASASSRTSPERVVWGDLNAAQPYLFEYRGAKVAQTRLHAYAKNNGLGDTSPEATAIIVAFEEGHEFYGDEKRGGVIHIY